MAAKKKPEIKPRYPAPPKEATSLIKNEKVEEEMTYKCTRCGRIRKSPVGYYYVSRHSDIYSANNQYTNICSVCTNDLFDKYAKLYKDEKIALALVCHHLDIYFSEELFQTMKDTDTFLFGTYVGNLNVVKFNNKTFSTFLVEFFRRSAEFDNIYEIRDNMEINWKESDRKNRSHVLKTIGYDCFEDDSYTDEQRRFLFNTLSDYLTDDVIEDPHKLQCVISMVKTTLQVENVDRLINSELKQAVPNSITVEKLTGVKERLMKSINTTANDNGISARGSGKAKAGISSLTGIMRQMADDGYEDVKVNLFDIKMSNAFKNIADISNQSLMDQLNLTSDDYARLVVQQRDMIGEYSEELDILREENRKLKVEVNNLKISQAEANVKLSEGGDAAS